jgi:hypothetical protein
LESAIRVGVGRKDRLSGLVELGNLRKLFMDDRRNRLLWLSIYYLIAIRPNGKRPVPVHHTQREKQSCKTHKKGKAQVVFQRQKVTFNFVFHCSYLGSKNSDNAFLLKGSGFGEIKSRICFEIAKSIGLATETGEFIFTQIGIENQFDNILVNFLFFSEEGRP